MCRRVCCLNSVIKSCSCAVMDSRTASFAVLQITTKRVQSLYKCVKKQMQCMQSGGALTWMLLLTNSRGPFGDEGPQGPSTQLSAFLHQPISAAALQGATCYSNLPLAALPGYLHCKTAVPVRYSSCIQTSCQTYITICVCYLCPWPGIEYASG